MRVFAKQDWEQPGSSRSSRSSRAQEKRGVQFCPRSSDPRGSASGFPMLTLMDLVESLFYPGGEPEEGRCKPHNLKATYRPRPWRFGGAPGKRRCKPDDGGQVPPDLPCDEVSTVVIVSTHVVLLSTIKTLKLY